MSQSAGLSTLSSLLISVRLPKANGDEDVKMVRRGTSVDKDGYPWWAWPHPWAHPWAEKYVGMCHTRAGGGQLVFIYILGKIEMAPLVKSLLCNVRNLNTVHAKKRKEGEKKNPGVMLFRQHPNPGEVGADVRSCGSFIGLPVQPTCEFLASQKLTLT